MKVLVVDDQKEDLYLLEVLLKKSGYEVELAYNGAEALEKLRANGFKVAISDILMPHMDGFQLCKKVKQDDKLKDILFVFYTATYTDEKDEKLAMKLGADKFIRKPTDPDAFTKIIKGVINKREKGKLKPKKLALTKKEDMFQLYSERLVNKLEKKTVELAQEVSERKRAEQALRESEERFHKLSDATFEGIAILDKDNILDANQGFAALFGYELSDVIGMCVLDFAAQESRDLVLKNILSGYEEPYEAVGLKKDGSRFISEVCSKSMPYKNRMLRVTAIRDISERKKLEAQLLQSQKMETIGTMAGGIAHDFNNILGPILGYADMALRDLPQGSKSRDDLEQILKAANRSKDLVQQILLFSRHSERECKPVRIHLIIKEALKLIRASIPATIDIRQNIKTDCGAVMANPTQIHQVFINLCTNAHHAMRETGGLLEVSLDKIEIDDDFAKTHQHLHAGKNLLLVVRDTGHGMNQQTHKRIFEPYFTTKEAGEGTGLGLSIAHGIVVNHGGEITVDSQPGEGTTVRVYLPVTEEEVENDARDEQSAPNGNESILFVDDQVEMFRVIKRMLDRLGYRVTATTSSLEALKLFRTNPDKFDLVITDQTMPQMTGVELVARLQEIRPLIPIILTSGFSEMVTAETAKEVGIGEYISKPFALVDLGKTIRRVLDRKGKDKH